MAGIGTESEGGIVAKGPSDNLSPAGVAAMGRAVGEATKRLERMSRIMDRVTNTGSRGGGGRSSTGAGGAGAGGANNLPAGGLIVALTTTATRLGVLAGAMERNTVALRTLSALASVSAASNVAKTISVSRSAGGDSQSQAVQTVQAVVAERARRSTEEQNRKRREKDKKDRDKKVDDAAAAEAKRIAGVPLERTEDATPGLPALELRGGVPAQLTPELERAGFEAAEAERRREKEAEFEAKLDAEGETDPIKRESRRKKSQQGLDRGAAQRRADFEARLAQRMAEAAATGSRTGGVVGLSPMEMTPAELSASQMSRTAGVKKPVAGGGDPFQGVSDLVSALRSNTDATLKNSQAIRRFGGRRGGDGGGDGGGGGPFILDGGGSAKGKGGLMERLDSLGSSLTKMSNASATMAGSMGAGVFAAVAAISPSAISTLTDSFGMLAGEVGKSFVPWIYEASFGLQNAVRWVGGLDEGLKSGLARVTSFAVIGLGGLAVVAGFTALRIVALTGTVRAFSAVLSFVGANQIVLTLAAVAAGVVTLTGQWENLGAIAGKALGIMGQGAEASMRVMAGIGESKPDFSILPDELRDKIAGKGVRPHEQAGMIAGHLESLQKDLETARQMQITPLADKRAAMATEEQAAAQRRAFMAPFREEIQGMMNQRNKFIEAFEREPQFAGRRDSLIRKELDNMASVSLSIQRDAMEEAKRKGININALEAQQAVGVRFDQNRLGIPEPDYLKARDPFANAALRVSALEKTIKSVEALAKQVGATEGMTNIKSPINSRYTDAMSFRDSVQLAALNAGDLEAKRAQEKMEQLYKEQQSSNAKLLEALQNVEKAVREMPRLIQPFRGGKR